MKIEKKYRWIKVAGDMQDLIFGDNNIVEIEVEGKKICIAKTVSGLKACSSRCPHAGGDISQGKIDQRGNVVCPLHGYAFDFGSGRDADNEGYFLKIYPVKEVEEGIFVGLD